MAKAMHVLIQGKTKRALFQACVSCFTDRFTLLLQEGASLTAQWAHSLQADLKPNLRLQRLHPERLRLQPLLQACSLMHLLLPLNGMQFSL